MTLWTPGGEHTPDDKPGSVPPPDDPSLADLTAEERAQLDQMQEEMQQVRAQLLAAPAAVVVANHAMGLYELAAIHLTSPTPKLAEASLAIDALATLLEGLHGRLGEAEPTLVEGLAQLKAAYLEVRSGSKGDDRA